MTILINLTLMPGLILAVTALPLLFWRSFRAHPAVALLVTLLSLLILIGAAISFDRVFPGCRSSYPGRPNVHRIYDCGLQR